MKIMEFGYKKIIYPLYSPDIALTDYYLSGQLRISSMIDALHFTQYSQIKAILQ